LIVSATAIPYHNDVQNDRDDACIGNSMPASTKPSVYAVSSTQSAAKKIREVGFLHLRSGTVTGIPSILLNEGALAGLDVIVLIVHLAKDMPDFHAAAVISEAISKLVSGIYCDIRSLIADAQLDENNIKISEKVNQNPIFR
jgi:predicted ATP-grasp superfamily ATP-dependent carboligase